ncbi:MAG: 5'/3'-nucleotidase SurE [Candidatus Bathyarchaeaceae archaeon]
MPTILLTNDDGIQSVGLVVLKKRLEKLGNVIVVAPKDERSGVGKALTTNHIKIIEAQLSDGSRAYAITGTPADAFFLATNKILRRMPDLLVAGINLGPNLGIDDLLSSGTLGAALEAAIHHVPAIAVSYCIPKITENVAEKKEVTVEELKLTATLAFKIAKHVLERGMPPDVDIISINVPEKARSKIEITSLSYKGYGDIYTKQSEGYRITSWALAGYPDDEPGSDLHAVKRERCISITPIKVRLLHNKKQLEGLLKAISA